MIPLFANIAVRHLLARKRQTLVSLTGIILGVAFFLAISAMMQGSEADFIRRLVDNSPHIQIEDEYRNPLIQPVQQLFPHGAVEIKRVKPETEIRGIRGFRQALDYIRTIPGLKASPMLTGEALISLSGKDIAIALNGVVPSELMDVSTIKNYMIDGSIDDLISNSSGIVVGSELARELSLWRGESINVSSATGQAYTFKILGFFRTGRLSYDESQAFVNLKRVQALLNRPNRANLIIVKLTDPYRARDVAARVEGHIGYKTVSWQEASEDIMSTLAMRNVIMYSVVSAVLIVAAFGIYNVISTVVTEKQRDIAILKSIGFHGGDILRIFLMQGVVMGLCGCAIGLPLGAVMMAALASLKFKFPGSSELINLPVDWTWPQFAIAGSFAMFAAVLAAFLPARKAARVHPVDILRGNA